MILRWILKLQFVKKEVGESGSRIVAFNIRVVRHFLCI